MKKGLILSLIVIFIFPILILFARSVTYEWRWPQLSPSQFQLQTWQTLIQDPKMLNALLVTAVIGLSVLLINFAIGIPAGRALAHNQFKGKTAIDLLLTAPILIPTLAIAMGLQSTFVRLGLANHFFGVIVVHIIPTLPYTVRIFRSGYERIGKKYFEQGTTLGVSKIAVFLSVEVPLLIPTIRSAMMLVLLISFSQYALSAIIGGGTIVSLAMIYYPYFQTANSAIIAAYSVIFFLLPVVFLLLYEGLIRLFRHRKIIDYQRPSGECHHQD